MVFRMEFFFEDFAQTSPSFPGDRGRCSHSPHGHQIIQQLSLLLNVKEYASRASRIPRASTIQRL